MMFSSRIYNYLARRLVVACVAIAVLVTGTVTIAASAASASGTCSAGCIVFAGGGSPPTPPSLPLGTTPPPAPVAGGGGCLAGYCSTGGGGGGQGGGQTSGALGSSAAVNAAFAATAGLGCAVYAQCLPPVNPCSFMGPIVRSCGTPAAGGGSLPTYGVDGSTVNICIAEWIYTYAGQTITVPPSGCAGETPATFQVVCNGAPNSVNLSYTLRLAGTPSPVLDADGSYVPEPPFNPGPYSVGSVSATAACYAGANSPPTQTVWLTAGPSTWTADGTPTQVDFTPSNSDGFGYTPQWLGFSGYSITNYPSDTWHITPEANQSALNVSLYQPSQQPGPGSRGPYQVTASGSYLITWGIEFVTYTQSSNCAATTTVVYMPESEVINYMAYDPTDGLYDIPSSYTLYWNNPHTQFSASCQAPSVSSSTSTTYHQRIDDVSASWPITAVATGISH